MEEDDVYAIGAVRMLITNFLASRLPGSLYEALVDKGKVAVGSPSITLARVAPKSLTLTIGAAASPDVSPETLLAAIADYVNHLGILEFVGGRAGASRRLDIFKRSIGGRRGSAPGV